MINTTDLSTVLGPRALEIQDQTRATIFKLRKQYFLGWSKPRLTVEELVDDTLTEIVVALQARGLLPVPARFDPTDVINKSAATVFARWRSFFEIDSEGKQKAQPRNPQLAARHDQGYSSFDLFRDDQHVGSLQSVSYDDNKETAIDLSMLNEQELSILSALGDGHTSRDVAEWHGWVEGAQKADHRAWIQAKLRTIRRKLCGEGVRTQAQAREWLEARV